MSKLDKNKSSEQEVQAQINKEILKIIDNYKNEPVNKFQVNQFNMIELTSGGDNGTDIQTVHFKVNEDEPENTYVCIIIYAGKEELTFEHIKSMFEATNKNPEYHKLKDRPGKFIDIKGLIVPVYLLENCKVTLVDYDNNPIE